MKEWIKKVKYDRSVKILDGSPADKYMMIMGLNDIISKLIKEIEQQENVIERVKELDIPSLITAIEHATHNIILMGQISMLGELQQVLVEMEEK